MAGDRARPDDGGADRRGALREGYIEVHAPPPLLSLAYKGHVLISEKKATMRDYAPEVPEREFELPVVLLVGTSMSAGKTTSAKVIVRLLREAGLVVVGAKLTGAGRYRDILCDAGRGRRVHLRLRGRRACLPPWSRRRSTGVSCATFSRA